MSAYTNKIEGIAEALSRLNVPPPEEIEQYYEERARDRHEQVLIEIEKIKQLNLSQEQLIADCAMLKMAVQFEQEKFAEYKRRIELLIKPALNAAAPMADTLSDSQSKKAGKPRGKIKSDDDEGETIGALIGALAMSREYTDEGAKELWMPFYSTLEERHLNPHDVDHADFKKSYIEFESANGNRKQITFGQFANIVSNYRSGKKSG